MSAESMGRAAVRGASTYGRRVFRAEHTWNKAGLAVGGVGVLPATSANLGKDRPGPSHLPFGE